MTRRRSGAPRRWAIIASGLVATAVVGLAIADAAQISVSGSGLLVASESRCTDGPVSVVIGAGSGNTTRYPVTVQNVAPLCANLAVSLVLYRSDGTSEATGTGTVPAGGGSFTVTTTGYNRSDVTGVALLIGTWGVPATWNAPPETTSAYCEPVNPGGGIPTGQTCAVSNIQITSWQSGGYEWANVTMTITASTNNARVTLDLSQAPFGGWTPLSVIGNGDFVIATKPTVYSCSSLPILQFNRNTSNGSWTLYFQATTQPNAFPYAVPPQRVCP